MSKIIQCPFCGRMPQVKASKKRIKIICECGGQIRKPTLTEAVMRWNNRTKVLWVRVKGELSEIAAKEDIRRIVPAGTDTIIILLESEDGRRYTREISAALSPFMVDRLAEVYGDENVRWDR